MNNTSLSDAVTHIDFDSPLVLVFADSGYQEILTNWYEHSHRFTQDNLLIIALDEKIFKSLLEKNIPAYLLAWSGKLNSLWIERVKLIYQLLSFGYIVIHSDVDAVWLKNPIDYCEKIDADIIFSQGTIWPPAVHETLSVVLCCGFFMLRPTEKSLSFLKDWLQLVEIDGDDQRALNQLLLSKGLSWNLSDSNYTLEWNIKQFNCFNSTQITAVENDLIIALLPHHLFQRLPENKPGIVVHPLSKKEGLATKQVLKKNDCWISDK